MAAVVEAKRLRQWVVTLNNPTAEEREWIADLVVADGRFRYVVGQYEVGANGTEHWQGYVQVKVGKTHDAMRGMMPRCWMEPRRANHEKARHYALKPHDECNCEHCTSARALPNNGWADPRDETEQGDPVVAQGQRSEIEDVMARVREGASDQEIAQEFPGSWVRYHRAFERYRAILQPVERTWITNTTVLYGPPGSGKTHKALQLAGPGAYWVTYGTSSGAPQYYDGYDGQECVVFDEFFGQIRRQEMCKLLDRYPCNVPTRGGQQPWLAKRVIITSNDAPVEWWRRLGLGPMARRLEGEYGRVVHMPNVYVDSDDAVGVGAEGTQCARCGRAVENCPCDAIGEAMERRGEWSPRWQGIGSVYPDRQER